jgi:hypothetical protein
MRLFKCSSCAQLVLFENTRCENCHHRLGYSAEANEMVALDPEESGRWRGVSGGGTYRFCSNAEHDACNWLIPADADAKFCIACRHNRTVPDLGQPNALLAWQKLEAAKHRLFYTLLRLDLPRPAAGEVKEPLVFDFLADTGDDPNSKVMTGHDDGVVTIALAEADDAEREKRRAAMGEPYRTLLGHFRHEVGHFYWDVLVRDGGRLDECRAVFGDDRVDYQESLKKHYEQGVPDNWQENFISAYATTHPWEDFAETWAHYLHIIDTLEMARALGLKVAPEFDGAGGMRAEARLDPYRADSIEQLVATWIPIAFATNLINRCMGESDLYPFVLSPKVVEKLGFIRRLVHRLP